MELYTHAPVSVQFPDAGEHEVFSFEITPVSMEETELSDFSVETGPKSMRIPFNDTISTPVGRIVVVPTLYYDDHYLQTPVRIRKRNMDGVVTDYQEKLQVALAGKGSTIIDITLEDASIPRAEDIINTLIAVYNEDVISDKNRIAVNTSEFINERLIIIEKELGNVDTEIESFKKENLLTDISSETGMYLQATSQYNTEELELENQLSLAKFIKEYLTDPHKNSDLIPANTGISDINIESQIREYNELLLRRDKLVGNSSSKNPVVMDMNNSLVAMKQTIIRAVDNLIVGLNLKRGNVRQRGQQTTRRISAVPSQQKFVLSVERQQKIKEALYLYLLNKREESALTQAITESNARIIDPASGTHSSVFPKTSMVLLAATLLGFLLPGGALWLKETVNTKVRNRKDVEDGVTIPFLGEIPLREKGDAKEAVVREHGRDSVSEAFRILRTNMDFMRVKAKDMKVIMFTSFSPSSGKTFVSTNLAMSIAQANKKVVLIDMDIRKGTLSSNVGHNGLGVTHYLSGKVENIDDIILKGTSYDTLDIIHAGPVPPNPAELLLSERLDEMIRELRERYDCIIIDNVPASMVADAAIVNRVADLTIYVIRAGLLDRRQLPELERMYRQEKFHNMSIVLNGV